MMVDDLEKFLGPVASSSRIVFLHFSWGSILWESDLWVIFELKPDTYWEAGEI